MTRGADFSEKPGKPRSPQLHDREVSMHKSAFGAVAVAVAMIWNTAARAGEAPCAFSDEGADCGRHGGMVFDCELTLLRYHQSGGVLASDSQFAEFGFEPAPRFTLGYELNDGLGTRLRYWFFDQTATTDLGTAYRIDTYYLDLEAYQRIDLSVCTSLEVSGGLRLNELTQGDSLGLASSFTGVGGTVGLQGVRRFNNGWSLYARGRLSVVQGDDKVMGLGGFAQTISLPYSEPDATHYQTEIGIGAKWSRCLWNGSTLTLGFGGEWQQWADSVVGRDGFGNGEIVLVDAGFGGVVLNAGLTY
jgi:hypothetical protein